MEDYRNPPPERSRSRTEEAFAKGIEYRGGRVYRLPKRWLGGAGSRFSFPRSQPVSEIEMARKKASPVKQAMTKSQVFAEVADSTGLSRKQVASVFNELSIVIERHIKKQGVGQFTLPGLLKIKTIKKPARKAQKGVPNPFRPGELMDVAAKPATTRVKILPLKKMKEMPL